MKAHSETHFENEKMFSEKWKVHNQFFSFTGSSIFKMIHVLGSVQKEVSEYLKKYSSQEGWLTEFNFRHNYSSPFRVNEGLDEHSRMSYLVTSLIKQAQVNKVLP